MTELNTTNNAETTMTETTEQMMPLQEMIASGDFEKANMYTRNEILQALGDINDDLGVDAFTPKSKATKTQLIELLSNYHSINSKTADQSFAEGTSDYVDVTLDKLMVNPFNGRYKSDYTDAGLQVNILRAGGLTKDPVVTHASNLGYKEDVFVIIAGNRSFVNLCAVLEEQGKDISQESIRVKVRSYDGSPAEVKAQIVAELIADNSSVVKNSIIDQLNFIKIQLGLGKSRRQIADDMGIHRVQISQIMALDILPERMKQLIHFRAQRDLYSRKSEAELIAIDCPFEWVQSEYDPSLQDISIMGMTAALGQDIVKLMKKANKKPNKKVENYTEALEEYNDKNDRLRQVLSDEAVIAVCIEESPREALKLIRTTLESFGLLERKVASVSTVEAPEPTPEPTSEPTLKDEGVEVLGDTDEVTEDVIADLPADIQEEVRKTTPVKEVHEMVSFMREDTDLFVQMLRNCEIGPSNGDIEDILADGVKNNNPIVTKFVEYCLSKELLVSLKG